MSSCKQCLLSRSRHQKVGAILYDDHKGGKLWSMHMSILKTKHMVLLDDNDQTGHCAYQSRSNEHELPKLMVWQSAISNHLAVS